MYMAHTRNVQDRVLLARLALLHRGHMRVELALELARVRRPELDPAVIGARR